ncbi:hypothetical protein [Brevundimonas sp. Root1279]|uniref:hypothetical protein n=1 Tax=Brevundimonas sp. Root1279 TaxID=1736443 RepID=UPI0006FC73C7|nr:hypothetical protein [Brevundimonas sp. Root1279]KQW78860.1 hypothetical protein ASC65_16265 [Brevundimonas sp. Root1279]
MSDHIISLVDRRGKAATLLAGHVSFSNRALELRHEITNPASPEWSVRDAHAFLEGRSEPVPFDVLLASAVFASHPGWGDLVENELGLSGTLNFEQPYFDLLQTAALSAADLELDILFSAKDRDVAVLSLSIRHKTA